MVPTLEAVHARIRHNPLLQRFTLITRAILALGFFAPGLTKLLGREFAPGIDPDHTVALYFAAFHRTGSYYAFVGLAQVVAAVLLLSRRTALIGACLYFPIILNIFAIVVATRFGVGTPLIAGSMTAACLWLLVWDAHRLRPLLIEVQSIQRPPAEPAIWDVAAPRDAGGVGQWSMRAAVVIALATAANLTLFARGLSPNGLLSSGTVTAAIVALGLAITGWGSHLLQRRVQRRRARTLAVMALLFAFRGGAEQLPEAELRLARCAMEIVDTAGDRARRHRDRVRPHRTTRCT